PGANEHRKVFAHKRQAPWTFPAKNGIGAPDVILPRGPSGPAPQPGRGRRRPGCPRGVHRASSCRNGAGDREPLPAAVRRSPDSVDCNLGGWGGKDYSTARGRGVPDRRARFNQEQERGRSRGHRGTSAGAFAPPGSVGGKGGSNRPEPVVVR